MMLQDKVAIVTGGALGIGRAIAQGLAEEGASVVIADISGATETACALRDRGYVALDFEVDVSNEDATRQLAELTSKELGGIDILVNNAGIFSSLGLESFESISVTAWKRVLEVNAMGTFLCTKAVVPAMRKRGGGRIVNLASNTPFRGTPMMAHYVSSKGAVVAFTRCVARELGKDNILMNAIAPGFTLSEGVLKNPEKVARLRERTRNERTIARDQVPEDIVGAVKFFVGPGSAFITGQTMIVDGGVYFS